MALHPTTGGERTETAPQVQDALEEVALDGLLTGPEEQQPPGEGHVLPPDDGDALPSGNGHALAPEYGYGSADHDAYAADGDGWVQSPAAASQRIPRRALRRRHRRRAVSEITSRPMLWSPAAATAAPATEEATLEAPPPLEPPPPALPQPATSIPADLIGPPPASRRRRLLSSRVFGVLLVAIGILLLAEGAVTVLWKEPFTAIKTARSQGKLGDDLKEAQAREARQRRAHRRLADYLDSRATAMNSTVPPGGALGRLRIDRIGINFVVVNSTDTESLKKGPAHYRETPLPGAKGNWTVGIAGHRTTYDAPFRNIDKLRPGDRITLTMPYATFTYAVEGTKIVDDEETGVFIPRGYDRLALTACHPLYSDAQRIIVYGRLVKTVPAGSKKAL